MPVPTERLDLLGAPARDEVIDLLLRLVVRGELPPGAHLNDTELLRLTRSSRAPLREALHHLDSLGLVRVAPRQFTEVTPIDDRRTLESAAVLGAVMSQALVEAVPRLDADDRARLDDFRSRVLADDDAARAAIDDGAAVRDQLGRLVLDRAGNAEYRRLCGVLWPYVDRSVRSRADALDVRAWRTHLVGLVQAALAGDVDGATRAWRAHLDVDTAAFSSDVGAAVPAAPDDQRPLVLRDRAARAIQDAILEGTLVPGEVIRESDLMAWLGVSRTPVREALVTLAGRGLVTLTHHHPARVATLDRAQFREVTRTLGVVRGLALRLAISRGADLSSAWADPLERLGAATTATERFDVVAAVARATEDAADNRVLMEVTAPLSTRLRWYTTHDAATVAFADADRLRVVSDALADGRTAEAEAAQWALYEAVAQTGLT